MATSKQVASLIRDGDVCHITLSIPPVPAARPRVGRWGTFYPKTYNEYRANAKEALAAFKLEKPYTHTCAVHVEFVVKKPAKPTNSYPRGDVDNYVKAILDSITTAGLYWKDDVTITELRAFKRYCKEGEQPCTNLTIWPAQSTAKVPVASGRG